MRLRKDWIRFHKFSDIISRSLTFLAQFLLFDFIRSFDPSQLFLKHGQRLFLRFEDSSDLLFLLDPFFLRFECLLNEQIRETCQEFLDAHAFMRIFDQLDQFLI